MPTRADTRRMLATVTPEFASVDQCEIISGVSKWTWRNYAYRGKIESFKVGSRLLIPLAEVRRVLAEGRRPRTDGLPAGAPSAKQRYRDRGVASTNASENARA
jgi:hypothetical protein